MPTARTCTSEVCGKKKPHKFHELVIACNPEDPKPLELMEQAIVDVAEGARKILESKLTKRAIVLLIQDSIGGHQRISRADVGLVIDHAAALDKVYLQ